MRLWWAILGLGMLGAAGCSGVQGTTGLAAGDGISRQADNFSLRIFNDRQGACQPGDAWLETELLADGVVAVDVHVEGAEDLNALYCAVDYDAGSYAPVSAAANGLLGDGSEVLELAVLSEPGTAYLGQVQTQADGALEGFSGDCIAARFVFETGHEETVRLAANIPSMQLPRFSLGSDYERGSQYRDYFVWHLCNPGDYDQNGEVGITDLAWVGQYYGSVAPSGEFDYFSRESIVDGDNNGEIGYSDVAVIAQNFNNVVTGFEVFASADPTDVPSDGDSANGSSSLLVASYEIENHELDTHSVRYEYRLYEPDLFGHHYWVLVRGAGDELGSVTNSIQLSTPTPPTSSSPGNVLAVVEGTSLEWYYANPGDFNQDGVARNGDAYMVYVFFGQSGPWPGNDVRNIIDGDSNNEIDLGDIIVIGQHFFNGVEGYHIYAATDLADYPNSATEPSLLAPFATIELPASNPSPSASNTQRITFSVDIPVELQGLYYWVRPYYGEAEGIASETVGGSTL